PPQTLVCGTRRGAERHTGRALAPTSCEQTGAALKSRLGLSLSRRSLSDCQLRGGAASALPSTGVAKATAGLVPAPPSPPRRRPAPLTGGRRRPLGRRPQ